jgi:acyl carrier protein
MLEDRVKRIIASQTGWPIEQLYHDDQFVADLGLDSLDRLELLMAFEEEFDLSIPRETALTIETVGDAVAFLRERL